MKTLVLGASTNPDRYAYKAIASLLSYGHDVVAIGKKSETVLGIQIQTQPELYADIDTVTLYVNPTNQREYYDYIIALKPRRVLFNPGTENPELFTLLTENGIAYEAACTLVLLATQQF
ncbi:CoA-binding protein [Flavobacterium agricola]|uniref:CoA-binding protein n=1 Tax=Flavobacterium agricola TaxID=2870839 RepID=A0ABY6LW23_9FLAO|nr:CoA-binding protein [Flavobacterium agricola]UYW00530.1 CoA-binding protein [Flavobacterium agricola]